MDTKYKVIIATCTILVAFAFGRYSAPKIPDSHSITDTTKEINKDVDTHKTTVITKTPDGKEVTTITEDTSSKSKSDSDTKTDVTITAPKTSAVNISLLAGLDTGRGFVPTYGISANKELIGPVTVGAFGLTNGTIGLSIGVNF
jgi:hypothetical protein